MEKVTIEFKFKVGDLVLPKPAADLMRRKREAIEKGQDVARDFFGGEADMRWVVRERFYQQCYNTFQIHYDCWAVSPKGNLSYNKYQRFTENEIDEVEGFPVNLNDKKK